MSLPLQGVLMTKVPEPGQVKTRLAPLLGEQGAAALHVLLLGMPPDPVKRSYYGRKGGLRNPF